jgi:hypothetical protein
MFFVGHISIAFLLTYFISLKFQDLKITVCISLVLFLSVLPDVDMVFKIVGLDLGHRSITHSAIMWIMAGATILCFFPFKTKHQRITIGIYIMAYLSHILIGDTTVAPINILYPLGYLTINSSITVGSLSHLAIEGVLLVVMAAIIIISYYSYNKTMTNIRYNDNDKSALFLFRYQSKLDGLLYPVLMSVIAASLVWISFEFEFSSSLSSPFGSKYFEIAILILLLHIGLIPIITIMWLTSRKNHFHLKRSDITNK